MSRRLVVAVLLAVSPAAVSAQLRLSVDALSSSTSYEVASVRRAARDATARDSSTDGRFDVTGMTPEMVLALVLRVPQSAIVNAPGWSRRETFDIVATAPGVTGRQIYEVGLRVLQDRFGLKVSKVQQSRPIYALVRARGDGALGPNLKRADDCQPESTRNSLALGKTVLTCSPWNAAYITRGVDRPVDDRTGIAGLFDITLEWTPLLNADDTRAGDAVSLFTALEEQLGLRLQPSRGLVEKIAVERIRRPEPN